MLIKLYTILENNQISQISIIEGTILPFKYTYATRLFKQTQRNVGKLDRDHHLKVPLIFVA